MTTAGSTSGELHDATPPWLKAMEHGVLGETRARAFLLERFWVLSRSVDVDGADYLIQRRLTAKTFLDMEPPRLGVVQVKFIQDGGTYITLPKSYVAGQAGQPFGEFFLLVCSGHEDEQRMFLLSAAEIMREFTEKERDGKAVLTLKGSDLLGGTNYRVLLQGAALSKIEHALTIADLFANRRFLFSSGYVDVDQSHIDHDYLLPLDNEWGSIKQEFYRNKMKLQSTLYEMESVIKAMGKILRLTDPDEACRLYHSHIAPHLVSDGWKTSLSFTCDAFEDEDFQITIRKHKERLAKLRELKVESSYFALLAAYEAAMRTQVPAVVAAGGRVIRVAVTYAPEDLLNPRVYVTAQAGPAPTHAIQTSDRGRQTLAFDLTRVLPDISLEAGSAPADVAAAVEKQLYLLRRPFQAELDKLYLEEDPAVFWTE
ncbi:hypothetical protein GGR34_001518 [Microvirga flocculans]|uniref:DUF4365 domain-containing protein n=1 Tax=Microvirga flocculans TaxID=217168 RepID=A0A7W6N7S1_9HYPH|nr:hypothetical protein [Microvirga flocculans]MBB4039871.1 hypothetical protein [Microvirga flocculans]